MLQPPCSRSDCKAPCARAAVCESLTRAIKTFLTSEEHESSPTLWRNAAPERPRIVLLLSQCPRTH